MVKHGGCHAWHPRHRRRLINSVDSRISTPVSFVIELRDVYKRFNTPHGPVEILHGVSLAVAPGEYVAVTGPSGSGKTTLLNLAALLDDPSSGTVSFDGEDVTALTEPERCAIRKHHIGMVFQKFYLMPHRTVLDNVLFRFRYVQHDRARARKLALDALDAVGLADKAKQTARLLSGGEMQRVAVARAVALPPRLLVADEPTGNLDSHAAAAVMACFDALQQRGISLLIVTHNEELLTPAMRHIQCVDGRLRDHEAAS